MMIVKMGGSLSRDPLLRDWLSLLATDGRGQTIVVPGGGEFADTVRAAQSRWQIDELSAHNMAVLGMSQFAHLLHALRPDLVLAESEFALHRALEHRQSAIWLPTALLRDNPDDLTNWSVTSDSLAAWLALQMKATHLVLVKSCPIPDDASLIGLADAGIVDACFPDFAQRCLDAGADITLVTRSEHGRVRRLLQGP